MFQDDHNEFHLKLHFFRPLLVKVLKITVISRQFACNSHHNPQVSFGSGLRHDLAT
jgi:hypothetical protein